MADKRLERAAIRPVKERIEEELLRRPGVNGVDINEKVTNGRPTGELAIVVYVDEKKPKSKLSKTEMIPETIEGIPTDVQQEKIVLQAAYRAIAEVEPLVDAAKYTTLHGGISMGPCRSVFLSPPDVPTAGNYVFTGTLGAIVKDRTTGAAMALTNFHVACIDDGWSVGDTMAQPSRVDSGSCPGDRFAVLTRATLSEHVDGAVVTIDSGKTTDCTIEEIGAVTGQAVATVGMAVRKRGRTTELTFGTVNSVDVTVSIDYGDGLGTHTLKNQIRVVPDTAQNARFSDHGDSGSAVVDGSGKVVGLLFAGTNSGSATYANPIQAVLDELNVNLCVKPKIILTSPIICSSVVTKPIVCIVTKPSVCHIVTKQIICELLTAPSVCAVQTLACPKVTVACPPVSLACNFDPGGRFRMSESGPADPTDSMYGRPGESIDDAFWLGYYTALEALSEAEQAEKE
jgi:hypothetical protein